jgi:CRISPR/Cas system CSM-associated protein Csm3 (group 7 of RAMP superfamily)
MNLTIKFTWTTKTPLRIHTGMARAGSVDRTVRERDGKPVLPGEAVKASIREAAERILRWQKNSLSAEKNDASIPTHPVLQRLFAPNSVSSCAKASSARYYFRSSVAASDVQQNDRMEITSTAINDETGTSAHNMLRSVELWRPGIKFDIEIEGTSGDWSDGSPDRIDLSLLFMAIAAVDSIGGGWGIGCGELSLSDLKYRFDGSAEVPITKDCFFELKYLEKLIAAIETESAAKASS